MCYHLIFLALALIIQVPATAEKLSFQEKEKHRFFEELLDPTPIVEHPGFKEMARRWAFAAGVVAVSGAVGVTVGTLLFRWSSLQLRQEAAQKRAEVGRDFIDEARRHFQAACDIQELFDQLKTGQAVAENAPCERVEMVLPPHVARDVYEERAQRFERRVQNLEQVKMVIMLVAFFVVYWGLCTFKNWYLLAHDTRNLQTLMHVLDHWVEYRPLVPEVFWQQFDTLAAVYQQGGPALRSYEQGESEGGRNVWDEEMATVVIQSAVMESLNRRLAS